MKEKHRTKGEVRRFLCSFRRKGESLRRFQNRDKVSRTEEKEQLMIDLLSFNIQSLAKLDSDFSKNLDPFAVFRLKSLRLRTSEILSM